MAQSRFSRRLGFLVILAALSFSMVLPAFALFDQDDTARGDQSLPIAENFSLTTYRDVAVSGTFSAVDPEGDPLTFRVTKNPARGAITFAEEGSARFTYTPYENKTGKDSFTYVAEDGEGNVSQPAVVSIKIQKPDTKVTYSDMAGNPAHKAAIALAERDIFVGEQMGETWFFRPEAPVTREEFLAMAMDVVELETLPEATMTGFADDDSISVWAKPAVIHSPLGPLTLFAEDDHLTALVYGDYGSYDDLPLFREAKRQLEAYFAGQRQAFSLPLNPDGTAFQRRVWQSLCDIPYGRVISYRELAAQVGSPRAFQAVGQANGRNPLPILIPCHRVIAADGTLGGYSSGVERKRFLLRLEGLSIPESKPPRRVGKRGVRAR